MTQAQMIYFIHTSGIETCMRKSLKITYSYMYSLVKSKDKFDVFQIKCKLNENTNAVY